MFSIFFNNYMSAPGILIYSIAPNSYLLIHTVPFVYLPLKLIVLNNVEFVDTYLPIQLHWETKSNISAPFPALTQSHKFRKFLLSYLLVSIGIPLLLAGTLGTATGAPPAAAAAAALSHEYTHAAIDFQQNIPLMASQWNYSNWLWVIRGLVIVDLLPLLLLLVELWANQYSTAN